MKGFDFWQANSNVNLMLALVLIVILLTYIAFKLSEKNKKSPAREK